jgi:hypothetical protein
MKIFFDKNTINDEIKSENYWAFEVGKNIIYKKFFKNRKNLLEEVKIEDADFLFLPYKWDFDLNRISHYKNKNVIAFFNDDYDCSIDLPKNLVLFRTSANKTMLLNNEKIMPAFCEEIEFSVPKKEIIDEKVISFCGQVDSFREGVFSRIFSNKSLNTNFIFRKGFWAAEMQNKELARQQYFKNINDSLFVLCMRGAGNFSYRLYETLSAGRIPIIVNSDLKLPLENFLNWNEFSVIVDKEEIRFLDLILEEFVQDKNLIELCKNNQKIWDEYLSPYGFIKNFKAYLND